MPTTATIELSTSGSNSNLPNQGNSLARHFFQRGVTAWAILRVLDTPSREEQSEVKGGRGVSLDSNFPFDVRQDSSRDTHFPSYMEGVFLTKTRGSLLDSL